MSDAVKEPIRLRVGLTLAEEHGIDPGDHPEHRLTVGRLVVDRMEVLEGRLPGTFVEGRTVALGDRTGGAGTTIAYPVYTFREGRIFGRQVVEFTVRHGEGGLERRAAGKWWWNGGTGAFAGVRGEGSLEARVITDPDGQSRRVVDYDGAYWFE